MSVVKINQQSFHLIEESGRPVLLDFYADWCGPCRMMAPVVEKIAEEHPELKVCKVDIDENPELAQLFNVMSIPTLAAFKDGQLIGTAVGYQPKENVLKLFK